LADAAGRLRHRYSPAFVDLPLPDVEPRVLFVAGWGRSGSTLLETLLAGGRAVSLGETFQLWSSSPLARFCSCGDRLEQCPVWGKAIASFDRPWDEVVDDMRAIRSRTLRVRNLAHLLSARPWSGRDDVERYGEVMQTVYTAIARATGATTLVDSSKLPLELAAIAPSCRDLRVIHLVRDPRAVAASWKRDVTWEMPDGSTLRMPTHSASGAAARWDLYHALTSLVVRRQRLPTLRVSYERLVRLDNRALETLAEFARDDELADRARRAGDREGLAVPVQHAIAGNPGRRSGEALVLREDDSWIGELTGSERWAAQAIGVPYLAMRRTQLS
jgi:hypothetical protein